MVMMKKNEKRETIIETRDQKLSLFIIRESLKEGFYRMGETRFRFAIRVMRQKMPGAKEKAYQEQKLLLTSEHLCRSGGEKVMEITCLSHGRDGLFQSPLLWKDSLILGSANGSRKDRKSLWLTLFPRLLKCSLHQQSGCKSRSISYSARSDFHSGNDCW